MKTKLLLFVLCISAFAKAQNVNIPDANWKNWLVNNSAVNTNGDSEIQVSEAVAFNGTLQPIGQNISDLTGIEAFINLISISLDFNPLTTVDLSQNAALRFLIIADTFTMTSLILPTNTVALETLVLDGNLLSSLDISMYPDVSFVSVSDNQLTSLDMRNGNFANIGPGDFDATSNPNLTCIAVDDVAYANMEWTNIDSQTSFATSCQALCVVNIPDTNFKAALVGNAAINTNGDTEIQCDEASAFNGNIVLTNAGISDLTGIEEFTFLNGLNVAQNQITTVDLSQNPLLTTIVLNNNNITSLNLGSNSGLNILAASNNPITSIDASQFPNLSQLEIANTSLTSIDVSQNTALTALNVSTTLITSVDVSANANLTTLILQDTPISSLDISQNSQITTLDVSETSLSSVNVSNNADLVIFRGTNGVLTSMDFSNNPDLQIVSLTNNNLSSLNVRNGNNTNITASNFSIAGNPNLTCVDVDDVAFATANWTNIDAQTTFSTNCMSSCIVNIPDATFKSVLVNDTVINTNGDSEIQCSEASAHTGGIFLFGAGVSDLTGLEAFTSLTELQVVEDNINTIDITNLVALEVLVIDEINIATLDLSQNTSLFDLRLIDLPNLMSLDLSQNTMINQMQLSQIAVTALDLSQNTQLNIVNFDQLQVTNLDFSNNPLSSIVGVSNNALLESLDMRNGNNTGLASSPNFTLNPNLSCIDVDDVAFATVNWTNIDAGTIFSLDCSTQSNNAPVAICQNFTLELDANGNATLNPSDIDNGSNDTDGTVTLSLDQTSFSCADIGVNTVTLTVTDDDGATDSCTATVTVEDNIAPMLTVPSNITVSNDPGECSAFVNLTIMNSDSCGLDTANTTNDVPAGFIFPVGVTTVTATATDVNGNAVTDSFTVTVNDTEAPVINPQSNITVSNDPGVCGAIVSFNLAATDNCATPTLTADFPSGSLFDVGTTTVTITADDSNGNTSTDTFTVTVNDTEAPLVSCPSNQTVTVNEGEQFDVPNFVSTGDVSFSDNCNGVSIIQTPNVGTLLDPGTETISFTVTDAAGNTNSCSFLLTIDETLSIDDTTKADFRIYPNPATTQITIEGTSTIKEVTIYNLTGQEVAKYAQQIIDIHQLPNAIYIMRITDIDDRTIIKRLIKN